MRKTASVLLGLLLIPTVSANTYLTPNVTRAEAAMIILQARLPSIPDVRDTKRFPDVVPGAWYERYVVLAERYGIMDSDPTTKRMRPEDPVHRIEFLRMLTFAFGLPDKLSEHYADIRASTDAGAYAGLAEAYGLFPADKYRDLLKPESEMTHEETARAVWILTQTLRAREIVLEQGQSVALDQATYQLHLYLKTSSTQDQVTLFSGTHGAATSAPHIEEIQAPVFAKAGDDVSQLPRLREEILGRINAERTKAGLPALRVNPTLEASAQIYAEAMASRGFFGHVSPEGQTLRDRMLSSGYYQPIDSKNCPDCVDRYALGENLAQGQLTPAETVRDWMLSTAHRAAILSKDFSETGIGISSGIWVEHFGGRK